MAAGWVWRWLIHTFSLHPSDWLLWRSSDSSWLSVEVTHTHLLSAPFWLTIVEVLRLKQLLVIPSSFWLLRTSLCLIVGGLAQEPSGTRVQRSTAARLCAGYIILSTTGRRRPWPSSHDLIRLYNFITNIYHIHYHNKPGGKGVASFAGLPHFCHLVCIQYNTECKQRNKNRSNARERGEGGGGGGRGEWFSSPCLASLFSVFDYFQCAITEGKVWAMMSAATQHQMLLLSRFVYPLFILTDLVSSIATFTLSNEK